MRIILTILLFNISITLFGQPLNMRNDSVKVGQFIALYDIYFEFNQPNLIDSNQVELEMIVNYLLKHTNIHIELGVHTNFRGSDEYNMNMSKKRAVVLKNYLVKKGIKASRIVAIGFGETKPVIEYEDLKKFYDTHVCGYYLKSNRRVTVVITKV